MALSTNQLTLGESGSVVFVPSGSNPVPDSAIVASPQQVIRLAFTGRSPEMGHFPFGTGATAGGSIDYMYWSHHDKFFYMPFISSSAYAGIGTAEFLLPFTPAEGPASGTLFNDTNTVLVGPVSYSTFNRFFSKFNIIFCIS
jgi:hypothetical protein